jgi:hypothetical protein
VETDAALRSDFPHRLAEPLVTANADEYEEYLRVLKPIVHSADLAHAFAIATVRHRLIEKDFNQSLVKFCPTPRALRYPHLDLPPSQYWQRNFFSTLFLSIFDAIGISPERQHCYGKILHAVRGIVTVTDNILDDERKGSVWIDLGNAKVLPNVLLLLLETGVLAELLRDLSDDRRVISSTWQALMHAMYALGAEESGEEARVEDVLTPARLLDEVHRFRGGGLLCLAFVAPEINERHLSREIQLAKSAVSHIGLALQVIDDITDFDEDMRALNHNMLRSWIVHRQPDGPSTDVDLQALSSDVRREPELHFRTATHQVMSMAIDMAVDGFVSLQRLGHPVDRTAAFELIHAMFSLRGLERLWRLFDEDPSKRMASELNYRDIFGMASN